MPAGTLTLYQRAPLYTGNGTLDFDLAGTTLTGALFLSTSNFATLTNNVYGDLTNEVATAFGYTQGGVALSGVTFTQSTTKAVLTSSSVQWTASGGSIVARAFVLYANATLNGVIKPLFGYALLDTTAGGTDVTATAGQPFIVTPDATLGWATLGPGTLA